MTDPTAAFGESVRAYRTAAGLSQDTLAERAGVYDVGRVERGEQNVTLRRAARIAAALDVPLKDLLGGAV